MRHFRVAWHVELTSVVESLFSNRPSRIEEYGKLTCALMSLMTVALDMLCTTGNV